MLDASGQICTLTNIPLSAILSGGTGAGALSVDDCFRYSNNLTRFSVEGTEVLSRPTQESHHFRDEEDSPIRVGTNEEGKGGEPPPPQATSSTTDIGEAQQPTFIGFAWRGLDAAATNPLVFDFTKNIEWRASPVSGLTHQSPRVIHPQPIVNTVLQHIDAAAPGWDARKVGQDAAYAVAASRPVTSGVNNRLNRRKLQKGFNMIAGNQTINRIARDMSAYLPSQREVVSALGGIALDAFKGDMFAAMPRVGMDVPLIEYIP
jgi:hypothetical protein